MDRLTFVGGIHGVGKSTFCKAMAGRYEAQHIIAGDLIRRELKSQQGKPVTSVEKNQDVLVAALAKIERSAPLLILDGHFCLVSTSNGVSEIPARTFEEIAPNSLVLLTHDIEVVQGRLRRRDDKAPSIALLSEFQEREILHARAISRLLDIPLVELHAVDQRDFMGAELDSMLGG